MSGIMGEKSEELVEQVAVAQTETQPETDIEVAEVSAEVAPAEEAPTPAAASRPRAKVGRPKKGTQPVKTNEVRATFIVDPEVVRKLKYISLVEDQLLKDVVDVALNAYVDQWESNNGKIRLPRKK